MKKRFLYGFLITVLLYCILAVGVSASGEVVSEGLEFTLNDDGVSYSVTGIGTCTGTDVIIPSEYEGLPVAKIGEAAFDGGTFSSITIPDSISFIGNDAFLRCSNLSRVNINSLTSWCNIEFQYESEYEDGVTYYSCYSNPLVYAHNLFIDGIQVTELVIPNEISEIKAFAFNGGNITQLTLHSNIDCIGIGAFMTCYGFSKLVIPEGVTNIEDNAFVNCKFTSVSIPTTLIEIGNNAFYNCTNLEAVYITDLQAWCNIVFNWEDDWDEGYWQSCDSNPLQYANNLYIDGKLITNFILPESITSLNPYVFQGASFNSVTLHDKITYIPDGAFCECSQMTEIYIPDTVTSIGDYSFIYCSKLEMLILNNVTTVGYNSVWGCNSIRAIYFKNTMPSGMDTEPNYFYKDDVICGYYVFENNDSIYGLKNNEITLLHSPKNISSSFEIPSSVEHEDEKYTVTSIAGKAFYECSDLETVKFPSTLTNIDTYVFYDCPNLVIINFNGTIQQWNECTAGISTSGNYTVYCLDGTISKTGDITLYTSYHVALDTTSTASIDDTVYLTISANAPFSAAELSLTYDTTRLTFKKSASILNTATVTDNNGILTFADYGESKSSYILAFDAIASGTADFTLTSAAFSEAENATSEDLIPAVIATDTVTVNITEPVQDVQLPNILDGDSSVEYGEDYTFGVISDGEYYDYKISATMDGELVEVIDNGDGTYTIKNVTGTLVIFATRTPKTFYITFGTETGVVLPEGAEDTITYGEDYVFALPQKEHYSTVITKAFYVDQASDNVPYSIENGFVTIKGLAITKPMHFQIDQYLTEIPVTVEGNGASDADYEPYAAVGEDYTLTLNKDASYDYVVTATVNGESVELTEGEGTYTISADDVAEGSIVFTITKTLKTDKISVSEYLTLDGVSLWLIKNEVSKINGMVYCYEGTVMFWSDEYSAYCMVVASYDKPEVNAENLSLITGTASVVSYEMDVNKSGKVDANDAQFIYNMYNCMYSGVTESVTVEKYLRADVNGDGIVNTQDSAAVIHHILSGNTPMLFSRRSELSFHFSLEVDGSSEKTVQTGDIITFTFRVNRTDSAEDYLMYAMQNEIRYDSTVLELIENSIMVQNNIVTADILSSDSERELYINSLSKSGDDVWSADTLVGFFQMRVLGTSGSATVSCQDCSMSYANGMGSYPVTYSNVTLNITDKQSVQGDIDNDGQFTENDLLYLTNYWAGHPGYSIADIPLAILDMDSDGIVTRRDKMILERHFAGWSGYETLPISVSKTD